MPCINLLPTHCRSTLNYCFAAGKTVEVLGLILASPAPPLPPGPRGQKDAEGLIPSRATLVVSFGVWP